MRFGEIPDNGDGSGGQVAAAITVPLVSLRGCSAIRAVAGHFGKGKNIYNLNTEAIYEQFSKTCGAVHS